MRDFLAKKKIKIGVYRKYDGFDGVFL